MTIRALVRELQEGTGWEDFARQAKFTIDKKFSPDKFTRHLDKLTGENFSVSISDKKGPATFPISPSEDGIIGYYRKKAKWTSSDGKLVFWMEVNAEIYQIASGLPFRRPGIPFREPTIRTDIVVTSGAYNDRNKPRTGGNVQFRVRDTDTIAPAKVFPKSLWAETE